MKAPLISNHPIYLVAHHDRCLWLPDYCCQRGDRLRGAYDLPTRRLVVSGLWPGEELGHKALQHLWPRQHPLHCGGGNVHPAQRPHREARRYSITCHLTMAGTHSGFPVHVLGCLFVCLFSFFCNEGDCGGRRKKSLTHKRVYSII